MKFLFHPIMVLAVTLPLLVNCSLLPSPYPDIEPYKAEEIDPEDDPFAGETTSDSVFKDVSAAPASDEISEDPVEQAETPPPIAQASVEKPKPTTPVVAPAAAKTPAARAQASAFKNGMHVFTSNCALKSAPNDSSPDAGAVTAGSKLWLDGHNDKWLKAYKKSGPVYIASHCVK